MSQLISLPSDANSFEANGTIYTFQENLSIDYYRMFERFRIEAGMGLSMPEITGVLKQNIDFIERFAQGEKVFADMVTLNYNTLKGVVNGGNKEPFAVWLCTLFFSAPDEDRRWFKDDVMRKKIIDWQEAGIDTGFFINRACGMISGFDKLYSDITRMNLGWDRGENPEAAIESQGPMLPESDD